MVAVAFIVYLLLVPRLVLKQEQLLQNLVSLLVLVGDDEGLSRLCVDCVDVV